MLKSNDIIRLMYRLLWWWFVVVVLVARVKPALGVVGGGPAAPPEPDAAVVFVQRHGRSARVEGLKDDRLGYYSFIGIRYAEPPVGPRRFQRPVRRLLAGELTATNHCFPCPQPDPRNAARIIGNEDCLCLNVFAPKMPGEEAGCPVIFFIHGGNYRSGSTASYGGKHFTQKDTILVTAQYRLGSLGFLSTGQRDASGNAGIFDLHEAMNWITNYIEFFGGDPTRVVVMGQGSGGSAASLLGLSQEGRSAKGVAALSGAPLSPGAVRHDPGKHAAGLANLSNCPTAPAERLLMCLRQLPAEKIVQADGIMNMDNMVDTKAFLDEISGRSGAGIRVEGEDDKRGLPPLVSEYPSESIKKNKPLCPLLIGVTSAETSRAVYGKYSNFLSSRLSSLKDFIKTEIIGGLRGVIQSVPNLLPVININGQPLPLADFYQSIFDSSLNVVDGLTQIAEATGDALFNFPAYQTLQAWSDADSGEAYLYSFEHIGNLSKGSHFLPGLALTDDASENSSLKNAKAGPAHGDELAYLFEPLDIEGKPIREEVSATDARVRDSFVQLISKFAHNLSPLEKKNTTKLLGLIPYSKDNDQYIKITDTIGLDKNFRFCQMGLWGNIGDRLNDIVCKNLISNLLKLPKLQFPLQGRLPLLLPGQRNGQILPTLLPSGNVQPQPTLLGNERIPNIFGGQTNPQRNSGPLPNLFRPRI